MKNIVTSASILAVSMIALVTDDATASHCDEIRCSYNEKIDQLEHAYRSERRAMYAAYECEREAMKKKLKRAKRHARHHRHAVADVAALREAIRCAHRDVHERMDALHYDFRAKRKSLVRARDLEVRACRTASCRVCVPEPAVIVPQRTPGFAIPEPRYLPNRATPPVPTMDGATFNHGSNYRYAGRENRRLHWLDVLALMVR